MAYREPPYPIYNKVLVIVSLLPTDQAWKPVDASAGPADALTTQPSQPSTPEPVTISAKEAAPTPPLKTKAWWADIRKTRPQRKDEAVGEYVSELHKLMRSANVTKVWSLGSLRRRLYDK